VKDYLVGVQLDEALISDPDIAISWPFADGDVRDWTQAEAIWCVDFKSARSVGNSQLHL
jgi:actin-related protein 9